MDIQKLSKIKELNVLVFGDMMVDQYLIGDVTRISPEAPVPIVNIKRKLLRVGGAGNVVNNLITLGASVRLLSCIGIDADGDWIVKKISSPQIDKKYLFRSCRIRTIKKTRVISNKQQYLRFDEEVLRNFPDELVNYCCNNIGEILAGINVIIVSDYGKGMVEAKLLHEIITAANAKGIITIIDPKGNDYSKYKGATICAPNEMELEIVAGIKLENEESIKEAGNWVINELGLKYLVLTRSEKGIMLFSNKSIYRTFPTNVIDVVDVVGAGDTIVSVLGATLAVSYSIEEACIISNIAAANVCQKFGTATVTYYELIRDLLCHNNNLKFVTVPELKKYVGNAHEKGLQVVFTNGCFDMLHSGHLSLLEQAKNFGDILIAAVNSDESVKKNKGKLRPIIDQSNRVKMLCALSAIDFVVLLEDSNPVNIISEIKPDVIVKGKDWYDLYMPEKECVENYGGKIVFIDLVNDISTSNIIKTVLEKYQLMDTQ